MGELYRLDFASGKSYVGITKHTAVERYKGHERAARTSAKGVVYIAWRKHGAPNLVVLATMSADDLYDAEREAIARLGTFHPGGYNLTPGGDIPPSLNPEVAAKIAAKLRGRKLSPIRGIRATKAANQLSTQIQTATNALRRAP